METTNKEVVERRIYEDDHYGRYDRHHDGTRGIAVGGLVTGIVGTVLAGSLWARGRNGYGNSGMPENININGVGGMAGGSYGAPSAFNAYEEACEGRLALTNEMWALKVNTMTDMYNHRNTDVAEKFSLYKSQTDADFGLYKVSRDLYDTMNDKLTNSSFGLYKEQRDNYDRVNERIARLEKEVAVGAAIRPYQDKLIQCEIDKAFTAGINYTDRKTCRAIYGVVGLPSTPTVTVLEGANPYGCNCRQAETAPAA